ncbi:MAG TPA: chondroitinase-B domain-containing protein [Chitinophagaceae bacterium]
MHSAGFRITLAHRCSAAIYLNPGPAASEFALAFNSIIADNVFANNNGYAINFNPLNDIRKKFSKDNNLTFEVPHDIVLVNNTFYNNKDQGYTFFKDDYQDKNRNNVWKQNIYWGNQTGLPATAGLEEKQPDMILKNGFYFPINNAAQNGIESLPGAYNSIEGIALNFDKAIRNSAAQRPLHLEDFLPKWMYSTLGDYYLTGKLSPELADRLQRVSTSRE